MYDVVVIGAGLAGLTAAYQLSKQTQRILILEKGKHVGGVIQTVCHQGYQVETGANTFISTAQHIMSLCSELGLQPVTTNPCAKKRFIYHNQQVIPVPSNPLSFLRSPLLSWKGKWGILQEPFRPQRLIEDESIAEFATRRLGKEALDNLLAPFLSGVYAGDPAVLSLPAVFPRLAEWEKTSGSIVKGLFSSGKNKPKGQKRQPYSLLSFEEGMQALPKALANQLPPNSIQFEASVVSIHEANNRYEIKLSSGEYIETAQVVMATPAFVSAHLLETLAPEVSALLYDIPYAPIAIVHFGLPKEAVSHPLDGFGVLATRKSGFSVLGSIFASSLFPSRAPEGHVLLSNFIGGALYPQATTWNDETLLRHTWESLQKMLGIAQMEDIFYMVVRWPHAIPQYTLGHQARIQKVKTHLQAHPGIQLAGNYLQGVSLNDCIATGKQVSLKGQALVSV